MEFTLAASSGTGEPVGSGGECVDGGQGGADTCFIQVDTADAGPANDRRLWQLVQDAVGDEGDVDAVKGGAETLDHSSEAGDDLGELVEDAADPEGLGIVGYGLQAQHVIAFGVALQRRAPKWTLKMVRPY